MTTCHVLSTLAQVSKWGIRKSRAKWDKGASRHLWEQIEFILSQVWSQACTLKCWRATSPISAGGLNTSGSWGLLTRCELQGYSLYLLYDMLLSFEPSMDEGVCTRKKSYWMDHYAKTRSVSDEPEGKKEPCDIQVKSGSKIRNIISQAMRILQVSLWTGDRRNGPINYEP